MALGVLYITLWQMCWNTLSFSIPTAFLKVAFTDKSVFKRSLLVLAVGIHQLQNVLVSSNENRIGKNHPIFMLMEEMSPFQKLWWVIYLFAILRTGPRGFKNPKSFRERVLPDFRLAPKMGCLLPHFGPFVTSRRTLEKHSCQE